jgi:hypothetical protein
MMTRHAWILPKANGLRHLRQPMRLMPLSRHLGIGRRLPPLPKTSRLRQEPQCRLNRQKNPCKQKNPHRRRAPSLCRKPLSGRNALVGGAAPNRVLVALKRKARFMRAFLCQPDTQATNTFDNILFASGKRKPQRARTPLPVEIKTGRERNARLMQGAFAKVT